MRNVGIPLHRHAAMAGWPMLRTDSDDVSTVSLDLVSRGDGEVHEDVGGTVADYESDVGTSGVGLCGRGVGGGD